MARRLKPGMDAAPAQTTADGAATKPRRGKRAGGPPSNVSDETIAEFYSKALAAKLEAEAAEASAKSARGLLGIVFKDAKKAGINVTALRTVLGWRKRETQELDSEIRAINRVAYVAKLPIGAQLGLFDPNTTVATAIENDQIAKASVPTSDELDRASADGRAAGLRELPENQCPHPDGSPLALRWLAARKDAIVEIKRVREMQQPAAPEQSAEDMAGDAVEGMRKLRKAAAEASA